MSASVDPIGIIHGGLGFDAAVWLYDGWATSDDAVTLELPGDVVTQIVTINEVAVEMTFPEIVVQLAEYTVDVELSCAAIETSVESASVEVDVVVLGSVETEVEPQDGI